MITRLLTSRGCPFLYCSILSFLILIVYVSAATHSKNKHIVAMPRILQNLANENNYQTSNRANSNGNSKIDYIILQLTRESFSKTIDTAKVGSSYASGLISHYLVGNAKSPWPRTDGERQENIVTQMVADKDIVLPATTANTRSISIAHVGQITDTDMKVVGGFDFKMYKLSARLTAYLAQTYNIPLNRTFIIGRDESAQLLDSPTTTKKRGPGVSWDWNLFMSLAHNEYYGKCSFPLLRKDDQGTSVLILQYLLNVNKTGIFDKETADALFELQQAKYISSYGSILAENWNDLLSGYRIIKIGDKDPIIELVQYLLAERFYYIDPKYVTGTMDKVTMAAFKQFKIDHVVHANQLPDRKSGILDFKTWSVLITGCQVSTAPEKTTAEQIASRVVPALVGGSLAVTFAIIIFIYSFQKRKQTTAAKLVDEVDA